MPIENEDFMQIRDVVHEIVSKSQEKLATMIANQFLKIEDGLSRIREEYSASESDISDVEMDHDLLKMKVQGMEMGINEGREINAKLGRQMNYIEKELKEIRLGLSVLSKNGAGSVDIETFERRIQRMEEVVFS